MADRACEHAIRKQIAATFPRHAIRGEEFPASGADEWTWLIDPIDGTRAYVAGFAHWGVLLGLLHHERPLIGVLVQPFLEETFVGDGQNATYLRRGISQKLQTRGTNQLEDAIFATTDPRLFDQPADAAKLERISENVRLVRFGTDCYQYAMVALGQIDIVIENKLRPWDILPLVPVVRSAGGIVTNWQGGDDLTSGEVIVTANAELHEQVLAAWQQA